MVIDSQPGDQKKITDLQTELTMIKSQVQTVEHEKIAAQSNAIFYMKENKSQ